MKTIKYVYLLILSACMCWSCEDYLDISPEAGLNEEEVFGTYTNFKSFFDVVYSGKDRLNITSSYPLNWMGWDQKTGLNATTDVADNGRVFWGQPVKRGQMGSLVETICYDKVRRPILDAMFKSIRVTNVALSNIDRVKDAPSEKDLDDLRGQAHFVRAYCHFILACYWGPMPYITWPIGGDDAWDIPRLSKAETFQAIANDLDSAYVCFEKAGVVRRDPGPGNPGFLEDPQQGVPGGMAAKALKARVLLYKASPLNNSEGTKEYEVAAQAAWEALQMAEKHNYSLMPFAQYSENNYGVKYCNEQIWAWNAGTRKYNVGDLSSILSGIFQNDKSYASGENPTQNMVDMYETKWGDPLYTEEQRTAAATSGHYNEQDPYSNRDPRFYNNIIYNQAPIQWDQVKAGETKHRANIYYTVSSDNKFVYSTHLDQSYRGVTRTGYYVRKYTDDLSHRNQQELQMTDPLIRLAELYLNYAEAVNEAYGPMGSVPGSSLTALQAINKIRSRAEMPDVKSEYTQSTETFRARIKNERSIELDQEGFHRFHDIRRWKDAPIVMNTPLIGMDIEKVDVSTEYPTGFKYTRIPLAADRQVAWKDDMYYFPFSTNDYFKLKVFDTSLNPIW